MCMCFWLCLLIRYIRLSILFCCSLSHFHYIRFAARYILRVEKANGTNSKNTMHCTYYTNTQKKLKKNTTFLLSDCVNAQCSMAVRNSSMSVWSCFWLLLKTHIISLVRVSWETGCWCVSVYVCDCVRLNNKYFRLHRYLHTIIIHSTYRQLSWINNQSLSFLCWNPSHSRQNFDSSTKNQLNNVKKKHTKKNKIERRNGKTDENHKYEESHIYYLRQTNNTDGIWWNKWQPHTINGNEKEM